MSARLDTTGPAARVAGSVNKSRVGCRGHNPQGRNFCQAGVFIGNGVMPLLFGRVVYADALCANAWAGGRFSFPSIKQGE